MWNRLNNIDKLNELLGAELGCNPFGAPLYLWAWTEDLTHFMQKIDQRTGQPVFDYECQCGTNLMVHGATCSGLVRAVPIYIPRKLCPTLKEQWVAVVWSSCGTPEEWFREFGTRLRYDPRGYRVPTNACLDHGADPDRAVTWDLIHKVRAQRKKTYAEWLQETEDAIALKERRDESTLDSMISDACTAFGNAKPGARMGGVSLPSKETSGTGEEAGRLIVP
jgi:hypothetical protein